MVNNHKNIGYPVDANGKISPRALAELIISNLYYSKPPIISKEDYDRAIDVVEEEILVRKSLGGIILSDNQEET